MISEILCKPPVVLRLLRDADMETLTNLAADKRIWEYAIRAYDERNIFQEKWLAKAVKQTQAGNRLCFTILSDDKIVGSSSYYDIDHDNKTMKMGYTWFHPSVWGTSVNALSKLILFEYAFEKMSFNRIVFSVDSLNQRSCRALEKLGVKWEGVLRRDMELPNGRVRDSVIFSVIREEWPDVKNTLEMSFEKVPERSVGIT